jgi:uncharacterized phage protein (TIGR01671 family)
MRPIEFRGWSEEQNKWEFGDYSCVWGKHFIGADGVTPNGDEAYYTELVAPDSVGQFTGMTDKNGVKIFEGDIVRWIYKPMPFKDTWREYTLTVQYDEGRFFAAGGTGDADLYCNTDDMVVISNDYEGVKE